jgi:hypothetical protein
MEDVLSIDWSHSCLEEDPVKILLLAGCLLASASAWAHGGGLNAEGCHTNRKSGDYHCHRAKASATGPFE